jgi:hypothetical protein
VEADIEFALSDGACLTAVLPPDALVVRGAFHPGPGHAVPGFPNGAAVCTLVLVGWTGGGQWPAFAASQEAGDQQPHPLDRWSRRLIDAAAETLDAIAYYPFGGPPYHPFQRWASRAEPVAPTPIGLLMHSDWGLWHAYRGALGFRQSLALTETSARRSPCEACADRPCLSACPVTAFSAQGAYDTNACRRHVETPAGPACARFTCAARRACPVVPPEPYSAAPSTFHMTGFLRGFSTG